MCLCLKFANMKLQERLYLYNVAAHLTNFMLRMCLLLLMLIGNRQARGTESTNFYYYKQLGIKEGLSQSKVLSIQNDYRGSLWIGTESGLNRYDNGNLKQYLHQPGEKNSLPSNYIHFIAEDSLLNLWIATQVGLCLYDRKNDNFQQIVIEGHDTPLIYSYLLLDDGIILGGENYILKFEYATRQWQTLYKNGQPYISCRKMVRYDNTHILLTSWTGFYLFDLVTHQLKKSEYSTNDYYTCIYVDSSKRLWISPYGKGLYCCQNNQILKHYTVANSALSYDVVYDIVEKDNQLWIATDGGGINILSVENDSFSYISNIEDDPNSFPSDAVCRIYRDPANNIWAGTVFHGLVGIKHVYANTFSNVPFNNPYGLSGSAVNSFFQDNDGIIWIGIDGRGVNRYDPKTGTFKHYMMAKDDKVTSIVEFSSRELLLFSYNKGFFLLDKISGIIRPFEQISKKIVEDVGSFGLSVCMHRISENEIVISMKHIYVYDTVESRLEKIAEDGKDYHMRTPLIVAYEANKIFFMDLKNIYEYDLVSKKSEMIYRGSHLLKDACMDCDGNFWLASIDGLIYYNPTSQESQLVHTALFNEVTSVMADKSDRIWIGTRQRLYAYSIAGKSMIVLDETDGIFPNEYKPGSHLLLQNGDVVVGGFSGMAYIDSEIRFDAGITYQIELFDVLLNGSSVMPEKESENMRTIEIPWNFTSLQLKALLNTKDVLYKNIFRFGIKELNQDLVCSNSNSFVLNYLPTGEYIITVSYYTRDGKWSAKQPILRILVTPPWWKTIWFYIGLCLLFGLLIYSVIYYILRKKIVRQRRRIIQLKNKIYEERINFLTNISHELRTPLTLICNPLKRILNRELEEEKDMEKLLLLIYKQACQMKTIIDMVLNVRKLEDGKEVLHVLPHSLNEWVHAVGDKFSHEFKVRGIKLEYELDSRITVVPFDKHKCEFVLSNFLMNSLKFSDSGSTVFICTQLLDRQDWVRIAVTDEGMGLSMVDTDSLFSNFYQGTHEKGGSGIGLSYAKKLVTLHNGKIGAMSNASRKGATFYYELPLLANVNKAIPSADCSQVVEEKAQEKEKVDYTYLKKYSVIVIDDTADLRNYLKEALERYFARVYMAKDGKEGLEQIKRHLPDIIISDVMMPRINGFELCRQVKTDLEVSHIPFILLTAYYNSQNMSIGYKTGADAFLPKPFDFDSLLALSYNQLRLREQVRLRYKEDNSITYKKVSFSNADETFLLKLNTLIMENIGNPELDVPFLAANMCISRSLLFKKVKAIIGVGIIDYVNKLRIERAVLLMNTTSMSISEISEIVGFSSLRYFSRVFKAMKGDVPSHYRKQNS